MNGTEIFIDTNICIYLLNGDAVLADLLQDQHIHISFITEIELFAFHGNSDHSNKIIRTFVDSVTIIEIDSYIKLKTIEIRKQFKLKLPDAIIAASAFTKNLPFITSDKTFNKVSFLDLVLYELPLK